MFHVLFHRSTITVLLLIVQAAAIVTGILEFSHYFVYVSGTLLCVSVIAVFWIINTNINPAYKLSWTIVILSFPIFGGLLYLFFGTKRVNRRLRKKLEREYEKTGTLLLQDENIALELKQEDKAAYHQSNCIFTMSGFPIYQNTQTKYLSPGEEKFKQLLEELKQAKHYIFLEYFIIQEGQMWNAVLEILRQKAAEGVDVRVIYDDCGSLALLPHDYPQKLETMGIKCQVFNPLRPLLLVTMNNRDHRKIFIIDGHTAFTGGINLADEYINAIDKHGHWKDASIMVRGEAVWSMTLMFLQMWNHNLKHPEEEYENYRPHRYLTKKVESDGYVQPYGDSPLDEDDVGQTVYLNLINKAEESVFISTPYLIADNEMVTALCIAAQSGVDVRIVTPYRWDKWYVHMVTRSYYEQLIQAGVKIYEYTPGFIHSKTFVVDRKVATVGSANIDYRSLYLHFECGVWMYRSSAVQEVYEDYQEILKVSKRITLEDCKKVNELVRILRAVIRAFAPLM